MANDVFLSFIFCTDGREGVLRLSADGPHKSEDHLTAFFAGLRELCLLMPSRDLELIIVSPAASQISLRRLGAPANLKCYAISHPLGSRGAARNVGFNATSGVLAYFVDQDTRLPMHRLPELAASLQSLELSDVCLASGPYESSSASTYWGRRYNWLSNLWLMNSRSGIRFLAGNCILRRSFFSQPLFNEALCEGGEEAELSARIKEKSGRILLSPAFGIYHQADHELNRIWLRLRTHRRAKRLLRHRTGRTSFGFKSFFEIISTPIFWDALALWTLATLLPIRGVRALQDGEITGATQVQRFKTQSLL